MRNEFERLEREITKVTDILLTLAERNESESAECRDNDDNFYLYHNGKVNAYNRAIDYLDSLRITAKKLKDNAKGE